MIGMAEMRKPGCHTFTGSRNREVRWVTGAGTLLAASLVSSSLAWASTFLVSDDEALLACTSEGDGVAVISSQCARQEECSQRVGNSLLLRGRVEVDEAPRGAWSGHVLASLSFDGELVLGGAQHSTPWTVETRAYAEDGGQALCGALRLLALRAESEESVQQAEVALGAEEPAARQGVLLVIHSPVGADPYVQLRRALAQHLRDCVVVERWASEEALALELRSETMSAGRIQEALELMGRAVHDDIELVVNSSELGSVEMSVYPAMRVQSGGM